MDRGGHCRSPPNAISLNVAVSALGWVAIGFVPDGASLVWTSTDGLSWVRAKPLKGGQPQTIIATTDGFLVGGQSDRQGRGPTRCCGASTDLVTWTRIKLPGKGLVTQLAQLPSGVILALVATVASNRVDVSVSPIRRRLDLGQGGLPGDALGDGRPGASELGTSGDLFIQLVGSGPAAGPFLSSVWTSTDGLVWQDAWTATGPLFAVASGPVVNVFGKGIQGVVSGRHHVDRDRTARDPADVRCDRPARRPVPRPRQQQRHDPPSIVVQLVPAVVEAAPGSSASSMPISPTGSAPPSGSLAP